MEKQVVLPSNAQQKGKVYVTEGLTPKPTRPQPVPKQPQVKSVPSTK